MFFVGICIAYIDIISWRLILIISVLSVAVLFKIEGVLDILGGSLLVYGATKERLFFLNNRFLTNVGDVSYELYLLHQNVGFVIIYYLSRIWSGYHFYFSIIAIAVMLLVGEAIRMVKGLKKTEV